MTFQKKCLIELSDIIAVQYACANCGAAVSVPISKINPEYAASRTLSPCPYCQKESGFNVGTNETRYFADFNTTLKNVVGIMAGRNLKMLLEIKCAD
jgi:DNA-directed RNA polymerase subunit RPC12/RpoP